MFFVFKILLLTFIIRVSITTEYRPVLWGAVFGVVSGVEYLVGGYGFGAAIMSTIVSGAVCALFLFVLLKLENHGILWWFAFILGLIGTLLASAVIMGMLGAEPSIEHGEKSALNIAFQGTTTRALRGLSPLISNL